MLSLYEELHEKARRQILAELRTGARSVGDLVKVTGLRQPNVSNHLARMRSKGLVRFSKVGRHVYYSLASSEVEAAVAAVLAIKKGCCGGLQLCPLVGRMADSAVHGDETAAGEVLDEALRANASMLDVYQDLLSPTLHLVAEWKEAGQIEEAQQHLAGEIVSRMMSRTVQFAGAAPCSGRTCLIGALFAGRHTIYLRMAADYMRHVGWRALYLGTDVAAKCFLGAVRTYKPELILIASGGPANLDAVLTVIHELAELRSVAAGHRSPHSRSDRGFFIGVGGCSAVCDPGSFLSAGADLVVPNLRTFACEQLPQIERSLEV